MEIGFNGGRKRSDRVELANTQSSDNQTNRANRDLLKEHFRLTGKNLSTQPGNKVVRAASLLGLDEIY